MVDRTLTDEEAALLGRVISGRRIPVRGRDADVALALADECRPPLLATGTLGDDLVITITEDGAVAWRRHRDEASPGRQAHR